MVILKTVPKTTLALEGKQLEFEYDGVKFDYLYRKSLRLSHGHRTVYLYDCSPLYGRGSLEDMATRYLGEGKRYEGKYQDKRFPLSLSRNEADEILRYCILDARLTSRLAKQWISTFREEFGFYPQRYFSAGSIMAEYVERELKTFPSFTVAPFSVQKAAYSAYYGGRFEVFRRGFFENAYHYDINSAYPYALSRLPDLSKGVWNSVDGNTAHAGTIGFYKIETSIPPDTQIGPFMFRFGQKVFSPTGKYLTWVTSSELETVSREWYRILEGYEWRGNSKPSELGRLMDRLFLIRTQKEEPKRSVYRILINSIYGKTAQITPKVGRLFSPVVAAYTTGTCRAMVYQAMNQKPNAIVACATDAVFSLEPLDLPIGKALGEWTFTPAKSLIFFMNGLYFEDEKVRSRGFSPKMVLDDGSTVIMTPDSIKVYEKEGKAYFKIVNRKPNSLLESLQSKTLNFAEFTLREREIDLNADSKRVWDHEIRHLGETALSKPLTLTG
jgi:hypothetical protein